MKTETDRTEHPFFSLALQVVAGGSLAVELIRRGKYDALLSGLAIAGFDYPLQWLNEKSGLYWRIKEEDTARQLRAGFPYEEPTLFFIGGSLACLVTDEFRSSFFRRWVPSVLAGLIGGLMDNTLNGLGKLELVHPLASPGVFVAYGLGTFGILSFRDLPRSQQLLVLAAILASAFATDPSPAASSDSFPENEEED